MYNSTINKQFAKDVKNTVLKILENNNQDVAESMCEVIFNKFISFLEKRKFIQAGIYLKENIFPVLEDYAIMGTKQQKSILSPKEGFAIQIGINALIEQNEKDFYSQIIGLEI